MAAETSWSSRNSASKKASTSANVIEEDPASQRFVIGKIDAGIAVLISDSVHLIEFPSLLLPAGVGPGSIVNIACSRNFAAEKEASKSFWDLQNDIFTEFGAEEPQAPKLRIRNTTQTSVTLEWDRLQLAKAKLLGLSIWRNGQRLTTIPNPLSNTSTKLSGLSLDTDYTFHLVLKTSAGTYSSSIVKTRTHTITDTSGISVCFGHVEPTSLLTEAKSALGSMKARFYDKIQIDTTHFVATSPASADNPGGGPGVEYQKALQLSIPVVSPEWVIACDREKKMVPISAYYIGTVNTAASLSSAQLVTPSGQIPPSKSLPARRATASTIAEEDSPASAPIPAVAPAPSNLPPSELAEEDPETPPQEEVVADKSEPVQEVPSTEPEAPQSEPEVPAEQPPADTPEIVIDAPADNYPSIRVDEPEEDATVEEPPRDQEQPAVEVPTIQVDEPEVPTIQVDEPEEDASKSAEEPEVEAQAAEEEPTDATEEHAEKHEPKSFIDGEEADAEAEESETPALTESLVDLEADQEGDVQEEETDKKGAESLKDVEL